MRFDISEIGAINCTLNFDEEWYEEYLEEKGLSDTPSARQRFVREMCDYDVEYLDSEYFHDMGAYDTMSIEEIEQEFGDAVAADVFNDCMDGKEHSFELQAYDDTAIDVNNPAELNAAAVKSLRHGGYFKGCRGFILTDGTVVYTDSEHNQCSRIPGIKGTFDFLRLGNIRVLQSGADIWKKPTQAQMNVMYKVLDNYIGEEFYLDLMDGGRKFNQKYDECYPQRVINDIRKFFGGINENKNKRNGMKIIITEQQFSILCEQMLIESMFYRGMTYHELLRAVAKLAKNGLLTASIIANIAMAYNLNDRQKKEIMDTAEKIENVAQAKKNDNKKACQYDRAQGKWEKNPIAWKKVSDDAIATVYNAVPAQCNNDVAHTASMFKLNLSNVLSQRVLAMERTYMAALGIKYGDVVWVEGTGKWDGPWQVQDTMNKRFAGVHKIDLLVPNGIKHGQWNGIQISVPTSDAFKTQAKSMLAPSAK